MLGEPAPAGLRGLAATELSIFLLGPPRVEIASGPLAIPRRQARALLYRLAIEAQPVPRESLCFLFWPDAGETRPAAT